MCSASVHREATVTMGRDYEGGGKGGGGYERQTEKRDRLRGAMDLSSLGLSGLLARGWDRRRCSPSPCSPCRRCTSPHYCRSARERERARDEKSSAMMGSQTRESSPAQHKRKPQRETGSSGELGTTPHHPNLVQRALDQTETVREGVCPLMGGITCISCQVYFHDAHNV